MFKGFPHFVQPATPKPIDHTQERINSVDSPAITAVRLELTSVLRLVKHSRFANHMVPKFGKIVGVQIGSTVEVTNALPNYPPPQRDRRTFEHDDEIAEREKEEKLKEQELEQMLDCEKFDTYVVGNYVIANLCSNAWFGQKTIDNLFSQVQGRHPAVLLVYDPCRTELGKLHIRCFTLTDQYIAFARAKKVTDDFDESKMIVTHGVVASGVLRELPVELAANGLHKLLLPEVKLRLPSDSSTVAASPKTIEYLEALLSAVNNNVTMLEKIQGQRKESSMVVAPKIDTLLLIDQIKEQTRHIEGLCDGILLSNRVSREI